MTATTAATRAAYSRAVRPLPTPLCQWMLVQPTPQPLRSRCARDVPAADAGLAQAPDGDIVGFMGVCHDHDQGE